MSEHICSLDVNIISHHISRVHHAILMQVLQDLYCFAAWGRTHIKACVVWLDLQDRNRDHAHFFLAKYPAIFRLQDQKLVKVFEDNVLPHLSATQLIKAIGHLIGVPLDWFRCLR